MIFEPVISKIMENFRP